MTILTNFKTSCKTSNGLAVLILLWGGILISSCNQQGRGFALPEGDIEEGKAVFTRVGCNACHSISEIEWEGGNEDLNIPLGGEVTTQKSYGELVTSVINPSHRIARSYREKAATEDDLSKMKNYNEVLSVQELIDLVAFLQSEYEVEAPATEYYPYNFP